MIRLDLTFFLLCFQHAYIFLNGVSSGWCVGDAVLRDRAFSRFPADTEGAGGGVIYL